jgi:hypothetical protein
MGNPEQHFIHAMNHNSKRKSRLILMKKFGVPLYLPALAIVLVAAGSLSAQSPSYTGVYLGQTSDGLGGFALFVDANQEALLIGGYLYNDDDGNSLYGSCAVNTNGNGYSDISGITTSFSISSDGSVSVNGSADDGSYSYPMEGSLVSSGPFLSVSGSFSTNLSGSQTLQAIVAPDGWIYTSSPNHGGGGRVQVTAYGVPVTENSLGHNVNTVTLSQNAVINLSGTYALNRVDSLPTTPMLGATQLKLANGQFIFGASRLTVGSTNILQACADLNSANWVAVATNVANASTASFTNTVAKPSQFYRMVQLP